MTSPASNWLEEKFEQNDASITTEATEHLNLTHC